MLQQFCYQKLQMQPKIYSLNHNFMLNVKQAIQTSVKTSTTSNEYFWNIPLRMSCQSVVSRQEYENTHTHPQHNKLFMKFLSLNSSQLPNLKLLQQMHLLYNRTNINTSNRIFGEEIPSISKLPTSFPEQYVKMLDFYCSLWVQGMGYKSQKNKKLILERLKLQIPINQLYLPIVFYQSFGAGFLNPTERWNLIFKTCKNGWEFFSHQIVEYWKLGKFQNKKNALNLQKGLNKNGH